MYPVLRFFLFFLFFVFCPYEEGNYENWRIRLKRIYYYSTIVIERVYTFSDHRTSSPPRASVVSCIITDRLIAPVNHGNDGMASNGGTREDAFNRNRSWPRIFFIIGYTDHHLASRLRFGVYNFVIGRVKRSPDTTISFFWYGKEDSVEANARIYAINWTTAGGKWIHNHLIQFNFCLVLCTLTTC